MMVGKLAGPGAGAGASSGPCAGPSVFVVGGRGTLAPMVLCAAAPALRGRGWGLQAAVGVHARAGAPTCQHQHSAERCSGGASCHGAGLEACSSDAAESNAPSP